MEMASAMLVTPTFNRSRAHDYVAREVKAVRESVGALEIANYAKHEFKGAGARAALNRILAGRVPKAGRLALTPRGWLVYDAILRRWA